MIGYLLLVVIGVFIVCLGVVGLKKGHPIVDLRPRDIPFFSDPPLSGTPFRIVSAGQVVAGVALIASGISSMLGLDIVDRFMTTYFGGLFVVGFVLLLLVFYIRETWLNRD